MATDYTDGLALKAMKNILNTLPSAYENGANDPKQEKNGRCFLHGWYGIRKCIPWSMPLMYIN